jgi:hypothetical protein
MIEQYVIYAGEGYRKITQETKEQILSYPGLVVKELGDSDTFVLRFEHEQMLTKEDFKLNANWYVAKSARYMFFRSGKPLSLGE